MKKGLFSFIMIFILGFSTFISAATPNSLNINTDLDYILSELSAKEIDGVLYITDFDNIDFELLDLLLESRQLACPVCPTGRISTYTQTLKDSEHRSNGTNCCGQTIPHRMYWYYDARIRQCNDCNYYGVTQVGSTYGHWCERS